MPNHRTCSVENCNKPHLARGLCSEHYQRFRRHGDPTKRARAPRGECFRFIKEDLPKLAEGTDECIIWPYGKSSTTQYGCVCVNGVDMSAHRAVCLRFRGPIPKGKTHAAHKCGNRLCVNPKHIYWASPKENGEDMVRHGRSLRAERQPNSVLSRCDVRQIRDFLLGGISQTRIAKRFGVSQGHVSRIKSRQVWGWFE